MIRINLLGQIRPKASRRPVDTGAALPIVFVGAGLVLGGLVLGYIYLSWQKQLSVENDRIKQLRAQKTELQQIKAQVEELNPFRKVLINPGKHSETQIRDMAPRLAIAVGLALRSFD